MSTPAMRASSSGGTLAPARRAASQRSAAGWPSRSIASRTFEAIMSPARGGVRVEPGVEMRRLDPEQTDTVVDRDRIAVAGREHLGLSVHQEFRRDGRA